MAIQTLINGKQSSALAISDRGLHYGDGLFETIAVQNKTLLCWEDHIARLQKGCALLAIPTPSVAQLKDEADSLITSDEKQVIKIIISRGEGGRGYALPEETTTTRIISRHPWPKHADDNETQGVNVRICDYRYSHNSVLAGVKHLNRLEQVLARSEWSDQSIAEGIVLDSFNNVIEGTMSNVFYIKDNTLNTPELSQCGIDGIIRKKIIVLANTLNISIAIKDISLKELLSAEEIFICNSIIGVWPVSILDNKSFPIGSMTKKIRNELLDQNLIAS